MLYCSLKMIIKDSNNINSNIFLWIIVQLISFLRPLASIIIFLFFSDYDANVKNIFYFYVKYFIVFIIFFSDFLDGKLARKWNVMSRFGSLWDPICDKFSIYIILYSLKNCDLFLIYTLIFKDLLVFTGGIYTQYSWKKSIYTTLGRSTMVFICIYFVSYMINKDFNILENKLFFIKILTNLVFFLYIVEYIYKLGVGLWKKNI